MLTTKIRSKFTSDANWTTPCSQRNKTKASGVFLLCCRYYGVCCQASYCIQDTAS